jgi:hypothetical protein
MNKILIFLSFVIVMLSSSCNGAAKNDDSIVGVWKEYRTNDDDYLLSSWKFNSDGSGLFVVEGMTNTQKIAFTWKKTSSSEIEINTNGETQTLEINNGLLIENGAFGTTVFKKQ